MDQQLPIHVDAFLRDQEQRAASRLSAMFHTLPLGERNKRYNELQARGLFPQAMREHVYDALRRKKTPDQLLSIVSFLYQLQTAVIEGEKLPAIGSPFCRIPFS